MMAERNPKRMQLKENHPLALKLRQLEDAAEGLKIRLERNPRGGFFVTDLESGLTVEMLDIESDGNHDRGVGEFPSTFEYKLVFDNPNA